jgi:photosystem II stability/assembly factor-like uncharacterized protein
MFTGYFETTYTEDYTKKGNPWTQLEYDGSYGKKAVTVGEDGNFYIQDDSGQVKKFDKVTKTFSDFGSPTPGYNPQQGFNQTLIVESDFVLSGAVNGGSSKDAGLTWFRSLNAYPTDLNPEGSNIHPDIHRFGHLDGDNEYWCLSDGGLDYINYNNETDKEEPTVTYKSEQVYVTQSYSVSINPGTDDDAYVIDNQDTGSFSKVKGTWYSVSLGDGIQSAINYNDSNIRYASNQNGALVKTDSGFKGQLQGNGGFINIPGVYFYFPLEMNKVNPDILYAGGDEVYQIDAVPTLAATSLESGAGTIGEDSSVYDIATHGTSIFASGVNGLRFSADSGANWSTVNFGFGTVNSLDFSAASNDVLYVTIPGYNPNGKVFKSVDGGTTFTNITGNLPNVVMKEVLVKQNQNTETLFVATEIGVYFTKNGGTNWDRLGQGLPNVDVRDIEIHYLNDKLVAATYGRGLWEIDIAAETLSTDNFSDNLNALSVYPNPANDILNINVKSTEDLNYLIYNVIGGVVQKGKLDTNNQIDISTLAKNVYILKVYNNNESFSSKFIKRSK